MRLKSEYEIENNSTGHRIVVFLHKLEHSLNKGVFFIIIYELDSGDKVHRFDYKIVIPFEGKRKVLSTEAHNGGYREDIEFVGNRDCDVGPGVSHSIGNLSYEEYQRLNIQKDSMDPTKTVMMETAARMENVAINTERYGNLSVTAIVTAGIYVNGGRVGDEGTYIERGIEPECEKLGTINIILYINANLSERTMVRALVTCTEAKTAALQELQAPSRYSRGIATGSGTDSTIIVSNAEKNLAPTNAGKHSKLGELIGKAVMKAVKAGLEKQGPLCAKYQHDAHQRLERFGFKKVDCYRQYIDMVKEDMLSRPEHGHYLDILFCSDRIVVLSSCLSHIMDQMDWELISISEGMDFVEYILNLYLKDKCIEEEIKLIRTSEINQAIENILRGFSAFINSLIVYELSLKDIEKVNGETKN